VPRQGCLRHAHPTLRSEAPGKRDRFALSTRVPAILALWQAAGEWPHRSAAFEGRSFVLERVYGKNIDAGYMEFLAVLQTALKECGETIQQATAELP